MVYVRIAYVGRILPFGHGPSVVQRYERNLSTR